jgi:hypothetical protein
MILVVFGFNGDNSSSGSWEMKWSEAGALFSRTRSHSFQKLQEERRREVTLSTGGASTSREGTIKAQIHRENVCYLSVP